MKSVNLVSILILFLLGSSCFREEGPKLQTNGEGEVISLPFVWKKNLHKGKPDFNGKLNYPLYFQGNLIIPMTNGTTGRLLALIDSKDGKTIWEWDDRIVQQTEEIQISRAYQNENLLFYPTGSRLYSINLETGQTHWKKRMDRSFWSHVYGKDTDFYMFGRSDAFPDSLEQAIIFKGDIQTGVIEEYLAPDFTMDYFFTGNRIGDVTAVAPVELDGREHLLVVWQEPFFEFFWQSYLGLWDKVNEKWVYEKTIINAEKSFNGILLNPPVVHEGRIYLGVGFELASHDIRTGEQAWKRKFDGEIFFSNFLIEEGMLIANNEDQFVYAFDPISGRQLWKIPGSGTSSKMSYMNGVVYFNGGASSKLHAVDIRSGKTVWKIDPQKIGSNREEIFMGTAIYTIPGENGKKGKVISLTGNFAYCFEAYR
jgi:outer membrane protein assembly factor BamB